jgi:autotransporter-associated beta strand protein
LEILLSKNLPIFFITPLFIMNPRLFLCRAALAVWTSVLVISPAANAAVTPGGTLVDKAIVTETGGGETLDPAAANGGFGTTLTHDFDSSIALDPTYEMTAGGVAMSSGRHLVVYSTRFQALAGSNRAEIQTNLKLAGTPLVAGRSQGFIRRTGSHNDTVMSGGAIITVVDDDDVLSLESQRSDINTDTNLRPARLGGFTSMQLLKLGDTWDFLSIFRTGDQAGTVSTTPVPVDYGTIDSESSLGTAFSFTAATSDITLNETGSYLVFANTGIERNSSGTRTSFQQALVLDGVEVPGTKVTTYARGSANGEQANRGCASYGTVLNAVAGQILSVQVTMESGGAVGTIKGNQTALTIIKLPVTAKMLSLLDTTNQEVNDPALDPVIFNTQVSGAISDLTPTIGGSVITANTAADYLFFGSVFTESDAGNDNQDRILPLHGWQIDGTGGMVAYGHGAQYNRDNGGNHTGGSWGAAILDLAVNQTVQLTTVAIANGKLGAGSTTGLQALNISSLLVTNDPAIALNLPIEIVPNTTGEITNAFLNTFDIDTPESLLVYTVDSVPTGGTLEHFDNGVLSLGSTFTQEDIDNELIRFIAGSSETVGGFAFTVSDGSASDSSIFVVNVAYPSVTLTIVPGGHLFEGDTAEFTIFTSAAPVGGDITVNFAYSGSATDGSDFTGVASAIITVGNTSTALEVDTFVDGLFEGAESIIATITGGTGPTTNPTPGDPASATVLVRDTGNRAPIAANLNQVVSGVGPVSLGAITVVDPDATYSSTISTAGQPLTDTNGITNETVFSDGRANDDASFDLDATGPTLVEVDGFSVQIAYTPQLTDLTGVVSIWEIGGSSNGSNVVLIDGIPHVVCKANGVATDEPVDTGDPGFIDLDWETGNMVVVPLTAAPLPVGEESQIAVVFNISGNIVLSSVNGAAEVTTNLTPQSGTNFRGDHTFNVGVNAGTGVGASNTGIGILGTTAPAEIRNPAGGSSSVSNLRFWNESSGSTTATAGVSDTVTATLAIQSWSAGAGDLTATSGNGETYAAGVWSVTGTPSVVNAAIAAAQFVPGGSTADPTVINVSLEDGDEDVSAPNTGVIIISTGAADPIYVDDNFSGSVGTAIADIDGGAATVPGVFGFNAFSTLADALAAVTPTGTVIVNDGDYSAVNITLADSVTLMTADAAGTIRIGDLAAGTTNSIVLQGASTLELGATNANGAGINSPISGSGNLTKIGTGRLVVRAINTYSGTTTINDGFYRIGFSTGLGIQSELAGDGPVSVNAPGILELNSEIGFQLTQTGVISGDGRVNTLGDGTIVFDGTGPNTFSGGLDLGDGSSSTFDGTSGGIQGFLVVNHSGHLGTSLILSRGCQLQAGSPGVVIPNAIEVTNGGFRCGGLIDFELAGDITTIDGSARGFGNYGLEGLDLTISGNIITTTSANVNFEGSNDRDNGTWTINGDITGPAAVIAVQATFDQGEVTFNGALTHAGTVTCQTGTAHLNGTHTGGGAFTVNAVGTLAGSGSTTSPLTVTGTATLNPTGTLTCGDLTLNGTLQIDLSNALQDQVAVNGTVDIGGGLDLSINQDLTPGDYILIANDEGGDAITGTFSGFTEGGSLGSGLLGGITYTGGGGDNNDVSIEFDGFDASILSQWRLDNYGTTDNTGVAADAAIGGKGRANLANFALGFDADASGDSGALIISGGVITQLGGPTIWEDPNDGRIYFQYTRRADFAAAGLTINEQFSNALVTWELDAASVASAIATGTGDDGVAIEAMRVELPAVLPVGGDMAHFARLMITHTP